MPQHAKVPPARSRVPRLGSEREEREETLAFVRRLLDHNIPGHTKRALEATADLLEHLVERD